MTKRKEEKVLKRNYCLWMDAEIRERVDRISARSPFTVSRIVEECVFAYLPVFEKYVQLFEDHKRRIPVRDQAGDDSLGVVGMSTELDALLLNPTYLGAVIASTIRDLRAERFKEEISCS